jgi:hypothetical protein
MALLLTSVFGVTGCGSDDDVQVESRVKNVAPEASGASDGGSAFDCYLGDLDSDLSDLVEMRERFGSNGKIDAWGTPGTEIVMTNFKELRASLDFPELSGVRSDLNGVHERLVSLDNLGSPLHGLIERISDIHNVMRPIEEYQHEDQKSQVAANAIAWYQPAPGGVFREFSPFRDISTSFNSTVDSRTYAYDIKLPNVQRDFYKEEVKKLGLNLEGDMRNAKSAREDILIHTANEKTYRDEKNSLYEARVDAIDLIRPFWRNQEGRYYIPDPKLASAFEEIGMVADIAVARFPALISAYEEALANLREIWSFDSFDYLDEYKPDLTDLYANLGSDFSEALELSQVSARFAGYEALLKRTNLSPEFLSDFGWFLDRINMIETNPYGHSGLRELRGLLNRIRDLNWSELDFDEVGSGSSVEELKYLRNSLDGLNLDYVFRFLFEENTMKVRSWIGKNKCGSSAPQSREQKLEGVKNHLENPDRLDGRHDDRLDDLRDLKPEKNLEKLDLKPSYDDDMDDEMDYDIDIDDDDDINDMIED